MKLYNLIYKAIFVICMFSQLNLDCNEYVYPVATFGDNIFVVYQIDLSHIELWLWNPKTKGLRKSLMSFFTPAGLQVLPGHKAFSFIHDDFIRIKNLDKRSPKRLDIYSGLYDFSIVNWIDAESFYLSAKMHDNYGIFYGNTAGEVEPIVFKKYDCMYPQKVNDKLFYIERKEYKHKIISVDYPQFKKVTRNTIPNLKNEEEYRKYVEKLWKKENEPLVLWKETIGKNEEVIFDWSNQSMSFLKMINEEEGYFLESPSLINRHDKYIPFSYHQIKKINGEWKTTELFSFSISTSYLMPNSESRLYESILPFLPRTTENGILFIDNNEKKHDSVDIYFYDFKTEKKHKKTSISSDEHLFFAPLVVKDKTYYGGQIYSYDDPEHDSLMFWINGDGEMCLELPHFKI